jgi:acetyl coenzyme A synthetase (ADP forming)-like protein
MSLLVLTGGQEQPLVIAEGEYVREGPQATTAEVAFLVDDSYQGKGLGTLLLERLALIAARHGISHFSATTELRNRRMLEVFRSSGFQVSETVEDGFVEVSFSIVPSSESVSRAEMREQIATVASLRPFFKPRGVAVIGASRDPKGIGHRILVHLKAFAGELYPINPKAEEIAGLKAFASVLDIPDEVELAVIATPAGTVLDVVKECGAKGVRSLVIITAGFAETGERGRELQEALRAEVLGHGMRLVGPNCLGVMNASPEVRLNASFAPVFPPYGPIAMSSQSGALGLAVLEMASDLGLGLSHFVSLGNKADVSGNDLLQYWEDDPDTKVILLYLESFGNPQRFARLARRVALKKPVLAVKAGRSQVGSKAAMSHTASLAASETAVGALFRQAGVIRADTLKDLFDVAALLADQPLPAGPRVAVISNAGGPAILAVDTLIAAGLEVPEASEQMQAGLRQILPVAASTRNPVDMIASASDDHYRKVVETALEDPGFDVVMVIFIPVGLVSAEAIAQAVREAVASARQSGNRKPVAACVMSRHSFAESFSSEVERIPTYRFPEAAARALGRAWAYAHWRESPQGHLVDHIDLNIQRAREVCRAAQERGESWLSPQDYDAVLGAFGLPVLEGRVAGDAEEAVRVAEAVGYPVVVKLASRSLVHKSEWDGVQVRLENAAAVRRACEHIRARLESAQQLSALDGFLVQPMVTTGIEVMVGVTEDPLFGPLIAFGLGGVHVEILRDVVFRITPLTDRDATEMVKGIRGYRLLQGYRGTSPADQEAIKDLLLRVSRLVEEIPEIAELDLNPIKVHPPSEGCTILDARIRVKPKSALRQ